MSHCEVPTKTNHFSEAYLQLLHTLSLSNEGYLQSHIAAINDRIKDDNTFAQSGSELSLDHLYVFEEWADKVRAVDPNDKELSDIWNSVLIRAGRGERIGQEVLKALKSLSPTEAEFLVDLDRRSIPSKSGFHSHFYPPISPLGACIVHDKDRSLLSQLLDKGLAEKDYNLLILAITSTIATFSVAASLVAIEGGSIGSSEVAFMAGSGAVAITLLRSWLVRWRPTWTARKLMNGDSSM